MKRIPFIMIVLVLGLAISCGNDPTGDGQVGLTLRTEDGIENFESILAPGSSKSIPTSIAPYVEYFEVQAFANGQVSFRNLLMMNVVSKDKLLEGDLLVMDVPSGKDMIFRVSTLDSKGVVTYSGDSAPLNIEPNTSVPIDVTLKKVVTDPIVAASPLILELKDFTEKLTKNLETDYTSTIYAKIQGGTINHYARIYTQTVKDGNKWILTNPKGTDIDAGGSLNQIDSTWTIANRVTNMLQIITVRAEDSQGVLAYGSSVFLPSQSDPLPIYMRYAAKLSLTFSGVFQPGSHRVEMVIDGASINLVVSGTTDPIFDPTIMNPGVFDAPSAEKWFPATPEPVGTRTIRVFREGTLVSEDIPIEVDFGLSNVTVNLSNSIPQ